ncbi:MAG: four helix bundle protein [Bacteroidales bacterium]|nr:four helix bundle protein [Bacteroidales bacterium]
MHNFKELIIWQKARELVKEIYIVVNLFPDDEKFGLISQIKRASVSIPANIAEGAGRNSDKDFTRFLSIANGSSYELETLIILSLDLKYLNKSEFEIIIDRIKEIQKMIYSFKNKINKS